MHRPRPFPAALAALAAAALLAGCASPAPERATPAASAVPAQWQAATPAGDPGAALRQWWQQFDDPLLTRLIDAAQAASPTLGDARARVEQARAARVAGGAALGPTLSANANATRGKLDLATPVGTSLGANLQAGWEIDLFGAARAGRDASQARLEGAQAQWHDARISVAAETGSAYLALRGLYFGFLEPLKQGELTTLCMKLHMREMLEPTGLWSEEIEQGIRPMHEALVRVLCRHVGVAQPDEHITRLAVCVAALGVHLHVGRDVTDALAPALNNAPDAFDRWLDALVMYAEAMVAAEVQRRASA